jgi:tetratricopeptide (TPR) repeat protein
MIIKEYKEAVKYFNKILKMSISHPQTYFGISLSLFKLEKYPDALKHINKGIELLQEHDDPYSYICVRGL